MGTWISAVMRSWSLPVGRLGNVHVRVHLAFVALVLYVWALQSPELATDAMGRGLALVGLMLASVMFHEFAHALTTWKRPQPQRVLILLPVCGVTLTDEAHRQTDSGGELPVALVGPFANLLLAGAAILVAHIWFPAAHVWMRPYLTTHNLIRSFVWINLMLAGLNILPAYPTDGGRVFRAELATRMSLARANRWAVSLGQLFAIVFIFTGFLQTWLLIAGFSLFLATQLEERSLVFHSVLESLRMEDVMLTDFSTLSPADTLEDALSKAVHTLQDDFPVIRGGDMVGVVSRQHIVDALRSEGNGYVQSVMNRVFHAAQRNESLASAMRKLASHNLSIIPVVDDGRLVGIVTFQNLMHSMRLLAESRRLKRLPDSQS